jgi:hypothetical protein
LLPCGRLTSSAGLASNCAANRQWVWHFQDPHVCGTFKRCGTFKIPMCPGRFLPPPPPAAAAAATAAAAAGPEPKHPLQHLAAAFKYSQQAATTRSVSSKPSRGISASGFRAQQKADAQAAGEA